MDTYNRERQKGHFNLLTRVFTDNELVKIHICIGRKTGRTVEKPEPRKESKCVREGWISGRRTSDVGRRRNTLHQTLHGMY